MTYTTNEEDQREAARIKARLAAASDKEEECPNSIKTTTSDKTGISTSDYRIPSVSIDEGAHKYVLMSAIIPDGGERQHFVVSRKGAAYHRNAAEPMIDVLERSGYTSVDVQGGGRISLKLEEKKIHIYGYSYGFGLGDHALSKSIVEKDARYKDFEITWSNDGY